ncbi:MAG: sodium-translocating pyrophosphatase, partial [Bacteroidetes bacterium]
GLFVGGMLPFVFSALSMSAVGRAAMAMIEEVRRQFKDIPELKNALVILKKYDSDMSKATSEDRAIFDKADGYAEYDKCVDISTKASIKEMVLPGLLAIVTPVLVGFIGGAEMLGGLLAGVTVTGVLMAIFQSNAGGAWDNAKKMIEEGVTIDGVPYGKGSVPHKASVVGDTVGDPFKDTSGPSLNILLKLMSVVALVIAPSIALSADKLEAHNSKAVTIELHEEMKTNSSKELMKKVRVEVLDNGEKTATVTTTTIENGEKKVETKILKGDEVDKLIKKEKE